jgi:hypothetical protein
MFVEVSSGPAMWYQPAQPRTYRSVDASSGPTMWHNSPKRSVHAVHVIASSNGPRIIHVPHVIRADASTRRCRHAALTQVVGVVYQPMPARVLITDFAIQHQPITMLSNVIVTMLRYAES